MVSTASANRLRWLPRTIDANLGRQFYDVRFESDLARAQTGDYDTSERDNIYGGRLTFTPWTGSITTFEAATAVGFHLKGITSLDLSPKVLAEIYLGQITNWDNPQITRPEPTWSRIRAI